jgi:hypothetical protein
MERSEPNRVEPLRIGSQGGEAATAIDDEARRGWSENALQASKHPASFFNSFLARCPQEWIGAASWSIFVLWRGFGLPSHYIWASTVCTTCLHVSLSVKPHQHPRQKKRKEDKRSFSIPPRWTLAVVRWAYVFRPFAECLHVRSSILQSVVYIWFWDLELFTALI